MSVINSIIIRLNADPTGLREGLERGKQLIQQFARDPRLVAIPEGATVTAGEKAAANLIAGLKNKLALNEVNLAESFVKSGDLDQFQRLGLAARRNFNEGLIKGTNELERAGLLSPNTRATLLRELDLTAKQAEVKMAQASQRAAQKARAASVFDPRLGLATTTAGRGTNTLLKTATADFTAEMNRLKTQLASGAIDRRAFNTMGQQAAGAFNQALVTGLNRLEGVKGFTDNMRSVIVDNFKLTGKLAANALGDSLRDNGKTAGQNAAAPFIANATAANRFAAVGRTMSLAITAPIVAAGYKAVSVAKDFESAMLNLRVRTGATSSELDALASQARKVGKESQFNATEVAGLQSQLATRGNFGIASVLQSTQPIINLATAQNLDLARSTDVVISAVRQFNLTAKDTPRVVDLLEKAAKTGGVTVDDLGTALNFVGPAAHMSGISLEETIGVLTALIPAVGGATRAGTTFNGILKNLQDPTKQQAAALRRMGVDVLDTQGKIRPLSVIVGELDAKLKGAGQSYAQFGQRAGVGAGALLALGATRLQVLQNALKESSGTAAADAAIQSSGLAGSLKRLADAAYEAGIAFVRGGLFTAVISVTHALTTFLTVVSSLPTPVLSIAVGFLGLAAVLGPMIYTVAKIVAGFNIMRATMLIASGAQGVAGATAAFASLGTVLATGGFVLAGLAIVATYFYFSGKAARDAQADVLAYQETLTGITGTGDALAELSRLNVEKLQALRDQKAAQAAIDTRAAHEPTIIREGQDLPKFNSAADRDQQRLAAATARVAVLNGRITEATKVYNRFAKSETDSAKAGEDLNKMLQGLANGDHFPIDDAPGRGQHARSAVDLLVDRLNESIELSQALRDVGSKATDPFFDLARALNDVNIALTKVPDPFGKGAQDATKLLRAAQRVKQEMQAVNVENDRIELLRSGNTPVPNVPQSANVGSAVFVSLTQNVTGFRLTMAKVSGITSTLGEGFTALASTVNETIPALSGFLGGLGRIANAAQVISSTIATPQNIIARTASGSVDAFGTAGNVLSAVSTVVGGVTSAVSAVSAVVGLFTDSIKRLHEVQAQNNAALEKLTNQLAQTARGASFNVDARLALNALKSSSPGGFDVPVGLSALNPKRAEDFINSITSSFGISLAQLKEIADSFGITLEDHGHLVAGALDTLLAALTVSAQSIGQFSKSLDDQRTAMDLLQNVNDVKQTPQQIIKNQLALLTQFSKPLGAQFAGLSADTVEGRKAIKAALQNLVQTLVTTGVTIDQLGNFQSLSELLSVLTTMEGAFDDLATSANTVSEALSNIPTGFRIALRTFDATTPVPPPALVPQLPTPPHLPLPSEMSGGIPTGSIVNDNSVTFTGQVNIVPAEGETSEDAFNRIVRSARTRARGRGKPSDAWPSEVG